MFYPDTIYLLFASYGSMGDNVNPRVRRRNVLKVAGGVSGATMVTGLSTASDKYKISGVTYDTLTHKTGSNANGKVKAASQNGLEGELRLGGFNLPLSNVREVNSQGNRNKYLDKYKEDRYVKGGIPLKLSISDFGDQLSGYLTRPGKDYGKLGFALFYSDDPRADRARNAINPDPRWENSDHTFNTP
jgi:hypothetical protein